MEHNYLNLDTKALLCFKKVAELEHMTKAARALFISQAQLSKIITDLEQQYGVKFFDRSGKGIKLNNCGKLFYQYTLQIIDLVYKSEKKVQEMYLHETSELTLGCNANTYVPPLLRLLKENVPGLKYRQMSLTSRKCLSYLKEGILDFALVTPMIDDPEITTVFLRKEGGIIIYPEGHWLEQHDHVSFSMLKDEDFVGLAKGFSTRDATDIIFRKYKFEPHYVTEVSDSYMIAQCVNQGLGISVVPLSMFSKDRDFKHRHVDIDEPCFTYIGLSYLKDRQLSDTDNRVIEAFISYFNSFDDPEYQPNIIR